MSYITLYKLLNFASFVFVSVVFLAVDLILFCKSLKRDMLSDPNRTIYADLIYMKTGYKYQSVASCA